jgi:hypothetical protein
VNDGLKVGEPQNRADLPYEISALYRDSVYLIPAVLLKDYITDPLGSVKTPNPLVTNIEATLYGWESTHHSDYLEKPLPDIWRWYEKLVEKSDDDPAFPDGIIPSGVE